MECYIYVCILMLSVADLIVRHVHWFLWEIYVQFHPLCLFLEHNSHKFISTCISIKNVFISLELCSLKYYNKKYLNENTLLNSIIIIYILKTFSVKYINSWNKTKYCVCKSYYTQGNQASGFWMLWPSVPKIFLGTQKCPVF
jgi:hypothetical protein